MLERYLLTTLPPTFYYVPDFITPKEEEFLWEHIYASPLPKWVVLKARRLQNWGGVPHPKGMLKETIPNWLQSFMDRVSALGIFGEKRANHALVNEYLPGQGIFPHHDGPLYYPAVSTINLGSYGVLDFYKPVQDASDDESTISNTVERRYIGSVLLEPRSLNVVTDELYTHYMHGIAEARSDKFCPPDECGDMELLPECHAAWIANWPSNRMTEFTSRARETRISVTIRHVPIVSKLDVHKLLGKS
ncbi:Calcium dependent cysteine protease [Fasciola hepatica]|uniref:Calcium dependent cysteine protease n=1 Tax=Fasciola hepatica TaxID=6192 RepID=A0A4E0QWR6_FASHE|nr:Calcium dependent cysteine protease [Fasciola hepatica]